MNAQLAGHRGWGREGDVPPEAEALAFLTLGAHTHASYNTHFVCVRVCV